VYIYSNQLGSVYIFLLIRMWIYLPINTLIFSEQVSEVTARKFGCVYSRAHTRAHKYCDIHLYVCTCAWVCVCMYIYIYISIYTANFPSKSLCTRQIRSFGWGWVAMHCRLVKIFGAPKSLAQPIHQKPSFRLIWRFLQLIALCACVRVSVCVVKVLLCVNRYEWLFSSKRIRIT